MNIDSLMSEEIFGPLLPIVTADVRQACEIMQKMEHPLCLYIFSTDKKEVDESKQNPPYSSFTKLSPLESDFYQSYQRPLQAV